MTEFTTVLDLAKDVKKKKTIRKNNKRYSGAYKVPEYKYNSMKERLDENKIIEYNI